ncbi:MAG: sigma-70 family RNA polymerase sigma factor [Nitrospirae bacterium]|nr:sigma-70 family RNA polymerase sigma factor [Nitrospirota bacterium]
MQQEEHALIKQCAEGIADTYAILVERHKDMVYNVAYRMLGDADLAQDLAQESFISAYNNLKNFRYDSKFSTWLYSIVINKCRDNLRSRQHHVPLDESPDIASSVANPEEEASGKQIMDKIQSALNMLPEDYREVIVLKHIEGLDYREMEAVLNVSVNALKVKTHRGREMLKRLLKEMGVLDE